jgi:hypothetical protein
VNALAKIGWVTGGYMLACLAAYAVTYAYQTLTQNAAAQASAGMYAFGDLFSSWVSLVSWRCSPQVWRFTFWSGGSGPGQVNDLFWRFHVCNNA